MPSPGPTASAGVPSEEAFFRSALKQALSGRQANEGTPRPESLSIDQVTRFINIMEDARTVTEETGSQLPRGIYKKER